MEGYKKNLDGIRLTTLLLIKSSRNKLKSFHINIFTFLHCLDIK